MSREATGGDPHHSDPELAALRLGAVSDRRRVEPDLRSHAHRQSRACQSLCCRRLYRRAEEYQLLVTFGLLQILEDLMRLIWGGTPLSADTLMDVLPILRVGGLFYPAYNLLVIGIGIVAAVILWAAIYHTKFGVMLRATSQDRRMASALGLNVGLVYVVAFGIGCFMAGLGGAIVVPTQAAVLGMGVDALVIAFVVVGIGGLGSLKGALVGAVGVSFVRTAGIQFFPELELAVLYLIAALVLLVRPTGLFGTAGWWPRSRHCAAAPASGCGA